MSTEIELILFDLGGVLVELGEISARTSWFQPNLSPKENWYLWLTAPQSHALEKGQITPREFAESFIRENDIEIDVDTFLDEFRDWVIGFYPDALSYLQQLSQSYRLGIFSNITEIHWPPLKQQLDESGAITDYFASYLIGQAKPDVSAFQFVAKQTGVLPEHILFVDDNLINVEGARSAGMVAHQVVGFDQLRPLLEQSGLSH